MSGATPPPDSGSGGGWGRLDGEEENDSTRPAQSGFEGMSYGSFSNVIPIILGVVVGVFLVIWGIIWLNGNSPYGYYPLIVGALALIVAVYLVVRRMRRRRRAG
jgi:hypothetical protein